MGRGLGYRVRTGGGSVEKDGDEGGELVWVVGEGLYRCERCVGLGMVVQ